MWPLPFRVWGVVEISAFELATIDSSIAVGKPHICHFSIKHLGAFYSKAQQVCVKIDTAYKR